MHILEGMGGLLKMVEAREQYRHELAVRLSVNVSENMLMCSTCRNIASRPVTPIDSNLVIHTKF